MRQTMLALFCGLLITAYAQADTTAVPLLQLGLLGAEGDAPAETAPAGDFTQGTWTFQAYGTGIIGDTEHGEQYGANAGVGYYFVDGASFNVELLGGYVNAEWNNNDDTGGVAGFDLLFRWHFVKGDNWSIFGDGGAGFQIASTDFPSDSKHNFRLMLGIGGTLQLTEDLHLLGGARYVHLSNNGTSTVNSGLDGALVYVGVMKTF